MLYGFNYEFKFTNEDGNFSQCFCSTCIYQNFLEDSKRRLTTSSTQAAESIQKVAANTFNLTEGAAKQAGTISDLKNIIVNISASTPKRSSQLQNLIECLLFAANCNIILHNNDEKAVHFNEFTNQGSGIVQCFHSSSVYLYGNIGLSQRR